MAGRYTITHKDLLAAVEDRHTFDKLYVMITNKAIEQYTTGAGKRSALKLHASLALLDTYGRYSLSVSRVSCQLSFQRATEVQRSVRSLPFIACALFRESMDIAKGSHVAQQAQRSHHGWETAR
jgi:hypothetical protein